jgi:hypothetical protein
MNLLMQLLAFVGVPGGLFALTLVLRSRERMRLLDIVRSTAEHGHPLSPDVVGVLRRGRSAMPTERDYRRRDYRRGVLLVAMGSGLALIGFCAYVFATSFEQNGLALGVAIAAFGALPGCIGAALIVLSRVPGVPRVD